MAVGNLPRLANLLRAPLGSTPVVRFALFDHGVHGAHGLFDGRLRVWTMTEDEIDIVELKAFQRVVNCLHQIFAIEGIALIWPLVQSPEKLGRNDIAGSAPARPLKDLAHNRFGLAAGIRLGIIKKVDAGFIGRRHTLIRDLFPHLLAKGNPSAKGEDTYL